MSHGSGSLVCTSAVGFVSFGRFRVLLWFSIVRACSNTDRSRAHDFLEQRRRCVSESAWRWLATSTWKSCFSSTAVIFSGEGNDSRKSSDTSNFGINARHWNRAFHVARYHTHRCCNSDLWQRSLGFSPANGLGRSSWQACSRNFPSRFVGWPYKS